MTLSLDYAAALDKKFRDELALRQAKGTDKYAKYSQNYEFSVEPGIKFDRIVQRHAGTGGSVHAFVEKATGRLVKAASFKVPAKRSNGELQSKFDLSTPEGFAAALDAADLFGGYLYIR